MGLDAIRSALENAPRSVRGSARLVLAVLALHADDFGRCYPSLARLCDLCVVRRSRMIEILNELEHVGAIRREGQRRGRTTIYRLAGPVQSAGPHPSGELDPTRPEDWTLKDNERQIIKKKARKAPESVEIDIPDALDCDAFRAAWDEWIAYRRERRLTVTPRTLKAQAAKLAGFGLDGALASIEQSIAQGWQGLFEPKPDALAKARADHALDLLPQVEITPELIAISRGYYDE